MIEIIREKGGLRKISEEWSALAERFGNPLICHEWFVACAESFCGTDDLHVVILKSKNGVRAIGPLMVARRWGVESLEIMGGVALGEPSGLLYDSDESLAKLLEAFYSFRCPIILTRIPQDCKADHMLKGFSRYKGIFIRRSTAMSAYVPIKSSWGEFLNSLSQRRRYDFRRAAKRAGADGKVSFRILCPIEVDLQAYLNVAFQIEGANWKGDGGSALVTNERIGRFFRIYSLLACRKKILRLCYLYIGEAAVAMLIGLEHGNRFWVLKIGYDAKWARCSPGTLLIYETIKYAIDKKLDSYEFLGADESWLHQWPVSLRSYYSVAIYPFSINSLVGLSSDLSRFIIKKVAGGATKG